MRKGQAAELLGAELENVVLRGRLTLDPWADGKGWEHAAPEYDDVAKSLTDAGSANHAPEAMGTRYSVDFRERGWNREREAARYFSGSRVTFLGTELDSTIYTYMPGHAVLQVCHVARQIGATETAAEAMAWLIYLAARCEMFRSPRTKRILTCGDRSAALLGPGEKSWQDRFADFGMGRRDWPSEPILMTRTELVREAFAPMREGRKSPLELLRTLGFHTRVTVRVAEWPNGKAVWRNGSNWDSDTQPVAGGREDGGGEQYAPANRGFDPDPKKEKHRAKGAPTVTEFPTGIRYESPVYGSVTLALPPVSQRTLDVEIGGQDGVRDLLAPAPPAEPGGPPPAPHPGAPPPATQKESRWKGI